MVIMVAKFAANNSHAYYVFHENGLPSEDTAVGYVHFTTAPTTVVREIG
jgi:hypothetical protein